MSEALTVAPVEVEPRRYTPKPLDWTEERRALLRGQVCPPSASDDEFALFLDWCRSTGLNPFLQQAYLIERSVNVGGRYVSKHQPMAGIGGFRALVDLQPDYAGGAGAAVYAGDKFAVNARTGDVVHEWDPTSRAKAGERVLGAWWKVERRGRVTRVVYLPLGSRIQTTREGKPTKFWASDPGGQILKCAEAAAYREAYPSVFSGVFIADEVGDDFDPTPPKRDEAAAASSVSATEALKSRIAKAHSLPAPSASTVEVPRQGAPASVDVAKPTPPTAKAATPSAVPYPGIEWLRWGRFKGKLIADLSTVELEETLGEVDDAQRKIKPGSKAPDGRLWLDVLAESVEAVRREIATREGVFGVAGPAPHAHPRDGQVTEREPGSEG
jgi:phage recombination protein Bet